jgi:peptide/nickel transport system substrate-binding protein
LTGGWVQEAYIDRQVLDSLVSQVQGGKIVPWLATSWKVSADQKTWTFTLKKGVKFTDGTPFNAAAVKANFEYWLDPKAGNSTVRAYIGEYYKSSKAVDDHTFELDLTKPYSPLLSALSQGYFGVQSPQALARGVAANCVDPVGTGPFIVQKWNRGQNIIFVRNPNYSSDEGRQRARDQARLPRGSGVHLRGRDAAAGCPAAGQAGRLQRHADSGDAERDILRQVLDAGFL